MLFSKSDARYVGSIIKRPTASAMAIIMTSALMNPSIALEPDVPLSLASSSSNTSAE